MTPTPPVIAVVGWKNSGKTTLVTKLIAELCRRGHRVASIKHAHHMFEIDHPGTDSFRHREAGASSVAIVSARRVALVREIEEGEEPGLDAVLASLGPADLVIVEGYKSLPLKKIEVRRRESNRDGDLAPIDRGVLAIAADYPVAATVPVLDLNHVGAIADFVETALDVKRR
ncbi:MAG: molybdopterin-guanine dinucleotide biosynthesis protein B [Hyphomicrobiaceae bacterium]